MFGLLLIACLSPASSLQDWPHWNGPQRTGVSTESSWSGQGELAWTQHVGFGYSSVAVVGGALYTLGHDEDAGQDQVLCLDAATGEVRWRHGFAAKKMDNFHTGGTLTTPAVVGERLFVTNREGKGLCLNAKSGELVWEKDYQAELDLKMPMYGFSASPLAHEGELFLLLGGTLLKVDPTNGEVLRRGEENWGDGGYSNPLPFDLRGRSCLAIFAGPGLLVLDRNTFEELHRYPWKGESGGVHAGTPLLLPDDRIFISSAYGAGAALLHIGEQPEPELLWRSRRMRNKVDGTVLVDGYLYGFDESMLKCLDLEGKERWRVRGLGMGAVSAAGDRLLILTSKGELIVAQASPDEFIELTRRQVLDQDQGVCWTFPVMVGGRVYCRGSEGDLACVDHRAGVHSTIANVFNTLEDLGETSWPKPPALFLRHLEATAGPAGERWSGRDGAHLEGALEITGAGITRCPMTIDWDGADRWAQTYDLGDSGAVHRTYDGQIAWVLDPFYGDRLVEGDELREWQDTSNLSRDLDWNERYAAWHNAGPVDFAGYGCWAVDVVSRRGARRRIFFDRDTGRIRGRDGAEEHMLVLEDYREFEGIWLATRGTSVAPETGEEERWFVTSVKWERPEASAFERPDKVLQMMRTPEEVEALNAAVRERFEVYFGVYGDPEAQHYDAIARDGEFTLAFGARGFALTAAEAEADAFTLTSMPAIRVVFGRDSDGAVDRLTLSGGPVEEPQEMLRQPD